MSSIAASHHRLAPHYSGCFGCGPDSAQGLRANAFAVAVVREVSTSYVFGEEHSGIPGIAHGGLVATLVDDLCGHLPDVTDRRAVTRHLAVSYLKPVLVGVRYDVVARVDADEGRKLFVYCEGRSPEGELTFRGDALFVVVETAYFERETG